MTNHDPYPTAFPFWHGRAECAERGRGTAHGKQATRVAKTTTTGKQAQREEEQTIKTFLRLGGGVSMQGSGGRSPPARIWGAEPPR